MWKNQFDFNQPNTQYKHPKWWNPKKYNYVLIQIFKIIEIKIFSNTIVNLFGVVTLLIPDIFKNF